MLKYLRFHNNLGISSNYQMKYNLRQILTFTCVNVLSLPMALLFTINNCVTSSSSYDAYSKETLRFFKYPSH